VTDSGSVFDSGRISGMAAEVIVGQLLAGVEGQLQAELHDFLDVGAGVALGLLGQLVQVELLGLALAAAAGGCRRSPGVPRAWAGRRRRARRSGPCA
jgi:hypothetical protein